MLSAIQAALASLQLPTTGEEPVAAAYRRFDDDLTLAAVAGDLGLTADAFAAQLPLLDPALQPVARGLLDRDDFAALYLDSLCRLAEPRENLPVTAACDAAAAARSGP